MRGYLNIVITLFIAVIGWMLTSSYNRTQVEIARQRNSADVEVARIEAALTFLNTYRQIADVDSTERDRAVAIAAPVLSPELAFPMALTAVSRDQAILRVLLAKYGGESWQYVAPALEIEPRFDDPYPGNADEGATRTLLAFLDRENKLEDLIDFIISDRNTRPQQRGYALTQAFRYIDRRDDYPKNTGAEVQRSLSRLRHLLANPEVSEVAKADIAIAAALAFDRYQTRPAFTNLAAKRFWTGLDLRYGETPSDYDLRSHVYAKRINYDDVYGKIVAGPQVLDISADLRTKLMDLNWSKFDSDQISQVLYSYLESTPRGAPTPYMAYLSPKDAVLVIQEVIGSLHSDGRKKAFAEHLGSFSGEVLFQNISQDEPYGRQYSELLLGWYDANYQQDWREPRFFNTVVDAYPYLMPRLNGKRYFHDGVVQPDQRPDSP